MDLVGRIDLFGRCMRCGRPTSSSGGCLACYGSVTWTQQTVISGYVETSAGLVPSYGTRWVRVS